MADEVTLPAVLEPTPLVLIQQALDAKIAPSDLKELFDLQVRYEQRRAEEAYADAITAFQAECPPIHKNQTNKGSGTRYADYEQIMRTIMPLLRKHRIVITWDTGKADDKEMIVICRVRVGVVEKITSVAMPVTSVSKMMNASQAGGTAVTYGRRYAITAALNLYSTDEDDDAQSTGGVISEAQYVELDGLLSDLSALGHNVQLGKFCAIFGADSLRKIPAARFNDAVAEVRRAIAKQQAKNGARAKEGAGSDGSAA